MDILRSSRGSALVFVLVVTVILLSGGVWAIGTYTAGVRASSQLMDKLQSHILAESTFQLLQYYAATGRLAGASVRNSLPPEMGMPAVLPLNGSETVIEPGDGRRVSVSLQDLSGRLNVVLDGKKEFGQMLMLSGAGITETAVILDSLEDWLDSDDFHRPNGAEKWYYRQHTPARHEPRNSIYIQHPRELALIRGLDHHFLEKLLPSITVAPFQGFNIMAMDAVMLAITLNCTLQESERLVKIREVKGYLSSIDVRAVLGRDTIVALEGMGFLSGIVRMTIAGEVGSARSVVTAEVNFVEDGFGPFRTLTVSEGI